MFELSKKTTEKLKNVNFEISNPNSRIWIDDETRKKTRKKISRFLDKNRDNLKDVNFEEKLSICFNKLNINISSVFIKDVKKEDILNLRFLQKYK